jgi:hypothetical protein
MPTLKIPKVTLGFFILLVCGLAHTQEKSLSEQRALEQWQKVIKAPYSLNDLPMASLGASDIKNLLSTKFLFETFKDFNDEMPLVTERFGDGKQAVRRKKVVHKIGAVALFQFIPNPHAPYGTSFKENLWGILRMGPAANYSSKGGASPFLPGMALKFFPEHKEKRTLNLHVMHDFTTTTPNCNLFFTNFTNLVPAPPFFLRPFAAAFYSVAKVMGGLPNRLSLNEWGSDAPQKIFFVPGKEAKKYPLGCDEDFRQTLSRESSPGDHLYDVYGSHEGAKEASLLGRLILRSSFVSSPYGDEVLYFRHAKATP